MDQKNVRNIGIKVVPPKTTCSDQKCPFHGNVNVKGRIMTAVVIQDKMENSVVVEWERRLYVPKYERYEKRRTKLKVHNPPCIDAKKGDTVKFAETRPLSKLVHNVIIEKI